MHRDSCVCNQKKIPARLAHSSDAKQRYLHWCQRWNQGQKKTTHSSSAGDFTYYFYSNLLAQGIVRVLLDDSYCLDSILHTHQVMVLHKLDRWRRTDTFTYLHKLLLGCHCNNSFANEQSGQYYYEIERNKIRIKSKKERFFSFWIKRLNVCIH